MSVFNEASTVVMSEAAGHKWSWCCHCLCWMVTCGRCGNNTCNAGYGSVDGKECPECVDAHAYCDTRVGMPTDPPNEKAREAVAARESIRNGGEGLPCECGECRFLSSSA
jgi:hypothetical protein